MPRPGVELQALMDTALSTTVSYPVQIPQWARYASLLIPVRDNAAITLQGREEDTVTADSDLLPTTTTSWFGVTDQAESATVAAAGTTILWIDITEFIQSLPANCYIRPVCGAAQDPGVTFKFAFRGA